MSSPLFEKRLPAEGERRWRCRLSEIDLAAKYGDILFVVEVCSRSDYGTAINTIEASRRRKLIQLAEIYLKSRRMKKISV